MKTMKTPRGAERTRRRAGLHQGWRIHGRGPKMQPAKVIDQDAINARLSSWSSSILWSESHSHTHKQAPKAKKVRRMVEELKGWVTP